MSWCSSKRTFLRVVLVCFDVVGVLGDAVMCVILFSCVAFRGHGLFLDEYIGDNTQHFIERSYDDLVSVQYCAHPGGG